MKRDQRWPCYGVGGRLDTRPTRDVHLLSDQQRDRLQAHLSRRTAELLASDGEADRTTGVFGDMVRDFALDSSGKRIRPQLVLWALDLCGGDASSDVAYDAACGWELFHAFLLVHDDIIDAATSRRSRPSLHRRLATIDSNSLTFGVNLGIVAGDLLFAAAMRLWHTAADDPQTPAETARRVLSLTSRVAMRTGVGQAADIAIGHAPLSAVTEGQVLDAYHAKTAAYTFEGPLLTGAIMADLPADACAVVTRYAVALGQAYQVKNDLLDLAAEPRIGCDLLEGKRTLPLIRAFAAASGVGRGELEADLQQASTPTVPEDDRIKAGVRLRSLLIALGGVSESLQATERLLHEAADAAEDPLLPSALAEGLQDLLAMLRKTYFVSETALSF